MWERNQTHLGEEPQEVEEGEGMCAVREREGREDGKLRTNPDDPKTDAQGYLYTYVRRAGAICIQDREEAKSDDDECPSDVVLQTITTRYPGGEPRYDYERWDSECEGEKIDPRADRRGSLGRLKVYRQVICHIS